MSRLYACALLVFLPSIALAAPSTFSDFAENIVRILNAGIGITIILGLVVYFFGIATSLPKLKSDDPERLRAHFVWGILALFIMVSVWGILALVRNTLFGGGGGVNLGGEGVLCSSIENCGGSAE